MPAYDDKNADEDAKKDDTAETPEHHEEGVVETTYTIRIGGKKVEYTAAAGRLLLREEEGKKRASFFFTSYTRNGRADGVLRGRSHDVRAPGIAGQIGSGRARIHSRGGLPMGNPPPIDSGSDGHHWI